MHVVRGLRQALVVLAAASLAAFVLAAVWCLVRGGDLRRAYGVACVLLGPLIAITGGTELARDATTDARAFLGAGPDREQPGTGRHLTPVGVFLFVSVPLAVLGGLLLEPG